MIKHNTYSNMLLYVLGMKYIVTVSKPKPLISCHCLFLCSTEKEVTLCQRKSYQVKSYRVGKCQATAPVQRTWCSGLCSSRSVLHTKSSNSEKNTYLGFFEDDCHCCKPYSLKYELVKLDCGEDGEKTLKYPVIETCACQECADSGKP